MGPFPVLGTSAKSAAGYPDAVIGLLGDEEDAQAAKDESSDSEGSVGPPTMRNGHESEEDGAAVLAAMCKEKEWFDAWRWGRGTGTWKHVCST